MRATCGLRSLSSVPAVLILFALLLTPSHAAYSSPLVYAVNNCSAGGNCDHGSTSVVDVDTASQIGTVPVGIGPIAVAMGVDGSRVYVANTCVLGIDYVCNGLIEGSVSVIDTSSFSVLKTIPVGWSPAAMVVSPDGKRLYASDFFTYPNEISVIDTLTNTLKRNIFFRQGAGPKGIAISPDGKRLYVIVGWCVTTACRNRLAVVNARTGHVLWVTEVGWYALHVVLSPDGRRAYVVNQCSDFQCLNNGTVSVIDTGNGRVIATVPVGDLPLNLAMSPDGGLVYVSNDCANCNNGSISVIDTATNAVVNSIPIPINEGYLPQHVTVTPDGRRLYVADLAEANSLGGADHSAVTIIDPSAATVIGAVTLSGTDAYGIATAPGALIALNSKAVGQLGEQMSGTVPALINRTSCTTTDSLVQGPPRGNVNFDGTTGAWTYTPPSATYSGTGTFTWRATAPASCTAADNPIDPVSNTAAVSIRLHPQMSGLADVSLKAGASATDTYSLAGTPPFRHVFASSNATVLPPGGMSAAKPAACGSGNNHLTCTVDIAAAPAVGTATMTVTAVDSSGVTASQSVLVTVTKPAPPSISGLTNLTATPPAASVAVPFKVGGLGALKVTAVSSNTNLLPNWNISGAGACSAAGSCELQLLTVGNRTGTSTVTMTVSDSFGQSSQSSFRLAVKSPNSGGGGAFNIEWLVLLAGLYWAGLRRRRLRP